VATINAEFDDLLQKYVDATLRFYESPSDVMKEYRNKALRDLRRWVESHVVEEEGIS